MYLRPVYMNLKYKQDIKSLHKFQSIVYGEFLYINTQTILIYL